MSPKRLQERKTKPENVGIKPFLGGKGKRIRVLVELRYIAQCHANPSGSKRHYALIRIIAHVGHRRAENAPATPSEPAETERYLALQYAKPRKTRRKTQPPRRSAAIPRNTGDIPRTSQKTAPHPASWPARTAADRANTVENRPGGALRTRRRRRRNRQRKTGAGDVPQGPAAVYPVPESGIAPVGETCGTVPRDAYFRI